MTNLSIRLPFLMVAWGTIACCHAAAKNYAQLMVLRVLLGFFESGFFVCVAGISPVALPRRKLTVSHPILLSSSSSQVRPILICGRNCLNWCIKQLLLRYSESIGVVYYLTLFYKKHEMVRAFVFTEVLVHGILTMLVGLGYKNRCFLGKYHSCTRFCRQVYSQQHNVVNGTFLMKNMMTGVLAYGILQMRGIGGLAGWQVRNNGRVCQCREIFKS